MFLNLEIENFNEKADGCLRTHRNWGPYITGEKCFVWGQGKEVDSCSVHGLSPLSDTSLQAQPDANH